MPRTRKNHPPSLKAKVAVEAIKAQKTTAQIAQVFGGGREQVRQQAEAEKGELYKQIGQLKVELDFLKKRAGLID